jgi:hypothetical protein
MYIHKFFILSREPSTHTNVHRARDETTTSIPKKGRNSIDKKLLKKRSKSSPFSSRNGRIGSRVKQFPECKESDMCLEA